MSDHISKLVDENEELKQLLVKSGTTNYSWSRAAARASWSRAPDEAQASRSRAAARVSWCRVRPNGPPRVELSRGGNVSVRACMRMCMATCKLWTIERETEFGGASGCAELHLLVLRDCCE
eukprot:2526341-Prymnesium_polylepis.1